MKHLIDDFGVTALIAVLVVIGSFILLLRGTSQTIETMIGTWMGDIIVAFFVIKSAKKETPK